MPSPHREVMSMNENNGRLTACPFFAALAPALAFSTSDVWLCLGCGAVMLLSGCGAAAAVRCFRRDVPPTLPQLAALMTAAALSVGGRLILTAAFPLLFESTGFFALAGAPFFFSAHCGASTAERPHGVAYGLVLFGTALVVLLGIVRWLFSFLPLSAHISAGLVAAAVAVAAVRLVAPSMEGILWEA